MTTQSEAALESGLIKTLVENSYERVIIKEEENLKANFKAQLEKHNLKQLQQFGHSQFTDKEFEKILICLEGGTRFEKAKKITGSLPFGNGGWKPNLGRIHRPEKVVSKRIPGSQSDHRRRSQTMPLRRNNPDQWSSVSTG